MRNFVSMRNIVLLLGLASPAFLFAQFQHLQTTKFQEPTAEELKMTADPKAPGASAVFLNVEEVTDDELHFHSFYARIKVLQDKGKELATVEVPYLRGTDTVSDIKARTIHSDGTVIPLTGKPEDLLISKSGDRQIGRAVFTLPSVEVGSILEYSYQIRYDDNRYSSPYWEIQRPYFVHKAHYAFCPFKAFLKGGPGTSRYLVDANGDAINTLMWTTILPTGVTIQSDQIGRYSVDITDVPPIPNEEWMPPINSILTKVLFYYKSASSSKDFWITSAKRWSKEVDHFAEQSKPIREAVSALIAPADSDLDKAKKLYKAVEALDNTDYSRKKSESELKQLNLKVAKRAEDTLKQKSGSSEDIAQLYLAMTRAAGLTAFAMKVVDRNRGTFDPTYLDIDQLDTTIVILTINGKEVAVDPGEKMCPFETLNWRHSNAQGIRQSASGPGLSTTPPEAYTANTTTRTGDLTLDAHGAITGTLKFVLTGQEALRWRQKALQNDLDEVKKQFDHNLESEVPDGVTAHIDHFLALDDPDSNLVAAINVQGTLGTATSKRLLLPGFFFESRGHQPFVNQEKRMAPVDMQYGEKVTDQVVYHLPAGLVVEGAPQDANNLWKDHGIHIVKTAAVPGKFTVARMIAHAFTVAQPEEYQDLRGFYQKVAASDQQQLILTTSASATAKGN